MPVLGTDTAIGNRQEDRGSKVDAHGLSARTYLRTLKMTQTIEHIPQQCVCVSLSV
jgi:hypothetical protein